MKNQTKTSSIINTVHEIITTAKSRGIVHLFTEDEAYDGRIIHIKGKELINFGSCSYMGLEINEKLKQAAIEAIQQYGVQFSSSRSYVACTLYNEWQELLDKIFNAHTITYTSVSLGHHAVMPIVIEEGDAIIMDQQVHASVQDAAFKIQGRGVTLKVVRHNLLDELENKIQELMPRHDKIWYLIDGVYSMYGDYAPMKEIEALMNKYKQFHVYADDAHGMSIAGVHGSGYVLSQIPLHEKMILATSLNKAFAAGGGCFVFPEKELYQKVKHTSGAYIFSGGHQIPVIGAGIASAKIHLSDEIYELQRALKEKNLYCHHLLEEKHLPVVSNPETPIFFVGLGLTRMGYNMVHRIVNDGFFVNLGIFPAVPETCTGLRFCINNHHTIEDIERLCESIADHFPKALQEENRTVQDIYRAFRKIKNFDSQTQTEVSVVQPSMPVYQIQHETSIKNISKELWNSLLEDNGTFDWDGLVFLEDTFRNNEKEEDNWDFYYYIIRDNNNKPVLATFFTLAITKDDMLASANVSQIIEMERLINPYYLTSKAFMMGSLLTEGNHLYIDRSRKDWKDIMMLLLDRVWKDQEKFQANILNLRDFNAMDIELRDFLMDQGFIKIDMPESNIISKLNQNYMEEFLISLTDKKRYKFRKEVLQFENRFEIKIISQVSDVDIDNWYQMYENVQKKNFIINTFKLPLTVFKNMAKYENTEIIELYLKEEFDNRVNRLPVAAVFCFKTKNYTPILVGLDYNFSEHGIYKQAIYQVVKRAIKLNKNKIYFGLTASETKKKFGTKAIPQVAYVQMQDNYSMSVINAIANSGKIQEVDASVLKKRVIEREHVMEAYIGKTTKHEETEIVF